MASNYVNTTMIWVYNPKTNFTTGHTDVTNKLVTIHTGDSACSSKHYFDLTLEGVWVNRENLRDKDVRCIIVEFEFCNPETAGEKLARMLIGD